MTDNPAIEAMARGVRTYTIGVMMAETIAQAAYDALAAAGFAVVPVEDLKAALKAPMIGHSGRKTGVYDLIRAMIAAATPPTT